MAIATVRVDGGHERQSVAGSEGGTVGESTTAFGSPLFVQNSIRNRTFQPHSYMGKCRSAHWGKTCGSLPSCKREHGADCSGKWRSPHRDLGGGLFGRGAVRILEISACLGSPQPVLSLT